MLIHDPFTYLSKNRYSGQISERVAIQNFCNFLRKGAWKINPCSRKLIYLAIQWSHCFEPIANKKKVMTWSSRVAFWDRVKYSLFGPESVSAKNRLNFLEQEQLSSKQNMHYESDNTSAEKLRFSTKLENGIGICISPQESEGYIFQPSSRRASCKENPKTLKLFDKHRHHMKYFRLCGLKIHTKTKKAGPRDPLSTIW